MDLVRKSVEDILGLDVNATDAVVNRLAEIGVSGMSDLIDVTVSDLTPSVLAPIPARKLVRHWASSTQEVQNSNQPTTPTYQAVPTTSISQTPFNRQLPAILSPVDVNWSVNFDVKICIARMKSEKEASVHTTARRLSEGRPLTPAERNAIIRYITDEILKVCSTPCRRGLTNVAESLVKEYSHLRDAIDGTVVGSGYTSIRNQLENRLTYLKRPVSCQRRQLFRRASDEAASSSEPKKRMRDCYGCIAFLPIQLPDDETEETLESKRVQLKDMYASRAWNEGEVSQLMNVTYIMQRRDLVGMQPMGARDVLREWPFLCEPRLMIGHLDRLLGLNVVEKLEANVLAKRDLLIQYFKSVAKTMKGLAAQLAHFDTDSHPDIGVILLIMAYFNDNISVLFHGYEIVPDSAEIEQSDDLPSTPMLVFEGEFFHVGRNFRLIVDKAVICTVDTPLAGFALLFGVFFIFNISYPVDAGATLEYVQRVLLGINPAGGSKVAKSRGRKARSGVHEGVMSLVRDLAVFSEMSK